MATQTVVIPTNTIPEYEVNRPFHSQEIFGEITRYQLQVAAAPKGVHTLLLHFENGDHKTLRFIH
ncbi:MAG: hypothetical protein LAT76_09260 [Schleiferiaceae bacterium]|nr:hypothetical protein [Schleiferiaceae bacterium]